MARAAVVFVPLLVPVLAAEETNSVSMFGKQRRVDPFAQYWDSNERSDKREEQKPGEEEGAREYVSPFRDEQAVLSAQRRRTQRFPTTSAASAYANARPEELGYKKIGAGEKRAKDISFPMYLEENEKKQYGVLKELESREAHLQYLKDSQVIEEVQSEEEAVEPEETVPDEKAAEEVTPGSDDEAGVKLGELTEPEPVVPEVSGPVVTETAGKAAEPVPEAAESAAAAEPVVPETAEPAIEQTPEPVVPEISEPVVTDTADPVTESAAEPAVSEPADGAAAEPAVAGVESVAEDGPGENAQEVSSETVPKTLDDLPDPLGVPMVAIPPAPRPFLHKIFKSAPVPAPNPVATPENPEYVVKTKDGHITKAVYDRIIFKDREHNDWIAQFKKDEQQKYDDKRADSNRKINSLRAQIKDIKTQMDELRKETDGKIEVSEGGLTRRFFELTQLHIQNKNKIFKDTQVIKSQKLSEKDIVVDKQTELQKEIDGLKAEKEEVENECEKWSKDLEALSARIDAKVADLEDINKKQASTKEEIDQLQQQKVEILDQIEKDNLTHADNERVIEGHKNKTYLPRLNEIDGQIAVLLGQLTTIRHHSANERAELSAITKRLDKERREHEEKVNLEAENRRRKEEELLAKQREELETKAQEARERHEKELQKLKDSFTDLEEKFKREQQHKKEALAFANSSKKNDSLFEYGTEEEIVSV